MCVGANVRKAVEIGHAVDCSTHSNLQYHAAVRHTTVSVVFGVLLTPVAQDAEFVYVVVEVARHERVQSHGKGAATPITLGPAVDISNF